jgi:hypothetical protein
MSGAARQAVYRRHSKIFSGKETKWIGSGLRQYPVNLYRSRTYIVKTRLASVSLITALLLLGGCYYNHYDDDDGWRDRGHRHHHRQDRDRDDDNRQYRDRDWR